MLRCVSCDLTTIFPLEVGANEALDVFVNEADLEAAKAAGRTSAGAGATKHEKEPGDDEDEKEFEKKEVERLLKESAHVV